MKLIAIINAILRPFTSLETRGNIVLNMINNATARKAQAVKDNTYADAFKEWKKNN